MNKISQKDFNALVHCCRSYDPFTQYIDNYQQMEQAEEANRCWDKMFMEIMLQFKGEEYGGVPYAFMNLGAETEQRVRQWLLNDCGIEVEGEPEKQKRVWTEDEIRQLVQVNDTVLYGALKKLYACQTADEKRAEATKVQNGIGFNAYDAKFLTSVAQFLIKSGFLTVKQKEVARKKLVKYTRQLTVLANAE